MSWAFSAFLFAFALFFFASSSFFLSLSSFPRRQCQLDFLPPSSFLSFDFLPSAFFSSVNVGMMDRLSVLVVAPSRREGCETISLTEWLFSGVGITTPDLLPRAVVGSGGSGV